MRLRFFPVLTLAAIALSPAHATSFCETIATRDGFVALRSAPNAEASLLARMKPGAEVLLQGNVRAGWERVLYWPASDRLTSGENARTISGWVNRRLIRDCG